MTDFTITNKSDVEVKGTVGEDRLTFIYNTTTSGVWLTGLSPVAVGASAPPSGGYKGMFDGYGSNNVSFTGIEHFTFTDQSGGNDLIRTGDGDDVLNGGGGNDTLAGWGGIDRIDGGDGTDFAQLALGWTSQAVSIDLNGASTFLGDGLLTNVEGVDLTTGSGSDTVVGHQSSAMGDVVRTGAGNDRVTLWLGGDDRVDGGTGSDLLVVTNTTQPYGVSLTDTSADTVNGGYKGFLDGYGANNVSFTGIERFSFTDLNPSGGGDNIRTGNGADTLKGGAGNDILVGRGGADVIDGGVGNDRWGGNFATSGVAFTIDLNGVSTVLTSGSVQNIEAMDLVTGRAGDKVTGHKTSAMTDSVNTGAGNDRITLWLGGDDRVDGGTGSDLLVVTNTTQPYGVSLTDTSADTVNGGYKGFLDGYGANNVTFTGIERFSFTDLRGGSDNIRTGDGADTLKGGGGNDALVGNGGADFIDGGAGNDRWGGNFATSGAAFAIDLNGISTLLTSGSVRNVEAMDLVTGGGSDRVTGHKTSAMTDSVNTGAGNDRVTLWLGGDDRVDGGTGSDLLVVTNTTQPYGVSLTDTSADTVNGGYKGFLDGYGANNVSFTGIERFSFTDLNPSGGGDNIRTGNGADTLKGGAGNDILVGNGGADVIDGGVGNDRWGGNFAASSVDFTVNLNGISTVLSSGSVRNIEAMDLVTGAGSDRITGHKTSAMADSIRTGAGNDTVTLWLGGDDRVDGGRGSDLLVVTNTDQPYGVWLTDTSADTVNGGYKGFLDGYGANNVSFTGIERFSFTDLRGGSDNIRTGNGADTLKGGAGNDALDGGGGADVLNGGTGADTLFGGAGNDTYYVDNTGDRVYETTTATSAVDAGGNDTVYSYLNAYTLGDFVENGRIMSTGTASLAGNGLNNTIYAGKGDNQLIGGSGIDTLSYAYGANGTTGVKVSLLTTSAQATGGSGADTLSGFERLVGSANHDHLTGNGAANLLRGGAGNDTVSGGAGNDTLYGDAGNDRLVGGGGNDRLIGGAGKDVLSGGLGNDVFDFNALSEMGITSTTRDVITDFTRGQDKIDLQTLDANQATAANDAFGSLTVGGTFSGSFASAGELYFDTVAMVLYGNTDADATAEFAIALTGITSLSATDLIL